MTTVHPQEKIFNDPIHGPIKLSPLCVKIVNTPQFERLRNIKQLGGGYYVFPGASHNRFEHSIGVCHLAGLMVRQLQSVQNERLKTLEKRKMQGEDVADQIEEEKMRMIDVKDIACVEIAGLCHDLGHGAFSHVFDRRFIPIIKAGKLEQQQQQCGEASGSNDANLKWKHEEASLKMFNYMYVVEENGLEEAFQKEGLDDNDIVFIKKLIHAKDGSVKDKEPRPKKTFLYEIVSNEENGIDVDKWDYFARDCHHLGLHHNFDYLRLINSARVITHNGEPHICYRDKDKYNVCNMFYTRNLLHRTAYQHKTVKAVEAMITDALVAVDDYLLFPSNAGTEKSEATEGSERKKRRLSETSRQMVKLSETVENPSAYMNVHDGILNFIKISEFYDLKEKFQGSLDNSAQRNQAFEDARDILDRIEKRKLYQYIGDQLWENGVASMSALGRIQHEKEIREDIFKLFPQADVESLNLKKENVVVQIVCFDYGKYRDPIRKVLFWKKDAPDTANRLNPEDTSGVLPRKIEETRVYVYYSDPEVKDLKKVKQTITDALTECSRQRKNRDATRST